MILYAHYTGSDGDSYLSVTPSPQVYSSLANIIWSPPISLQNVASYYVLTMTSREGLMQHGRHWTIGPRQTFNLTLLIGMRILIMLCLALCILLYYRAICTSFIKCYYCY